MWRDAYSRIVGQFNGHKALLQAAEQNRLERFFTFPNFAASADRCGQELRAAGLSEVTVERFPADGTTAWYGWKSMKAWDVTAARLWMTSPSPVLLCDWSTVPESLVMYSGPCEVEAELVPWDGEADVDLTGKVPFTRYRINDVFPQLRRQGVRGIVSAWVMERIGVLSGTHLAFLAACEGKAARWLAQVVAGANRQQWQGAQLRLLSLYRHNLDLLFHRILYWADGERSLMEIVERLEFERDELQRDTSISRTSSGLAIAESRSLQLDVAAVLALVDRIVASGYLKVR